MQRSWALVIPVLLGACAVDGQAPAPMVVASAVPASPSSPDPSGVGTTVGPSAGPAEAAPAIPAPEPLSLVGMNDRAVVEALGQPALKRRDRPAEYWLYSGHGCRLDLFLYPDPDTGRSRVTYYELHRPDGPQLSETGCGPTLDRVAPMETDTAASERVGH